MKSKDRIVMVGETEVKLGNFATIDGATVCCTNPQYIALLRNGQAEELLEWVRNNVIDQSPYRIIA